MVFAPGTGALLIKGYALEKERPMSVFSSAAVEHVSICEALDRILNKGAVIVGEVKISVADIDLIYLGLQIVLSSVETCRDNVCTDGK